MYHPPHIRDEKGSFKGPVWSPKKEEGAAGGVGKGVGNVENVSYTGKFTCTLVKRGIDTGREEKSLRQRGEK